ncbi:MAG TPA: antiterminator LoaP [Candidatus Eubacterium avistercoris]|uniref:Transcription termination/antitermination protein NusG n=1 Tax=Candidatus Eubacterium avistercoris TaxID=2838567 RepID=A0A9D2IG44_9FIRM|nr:antiterminator LoaP [Candidatus Eubacterium avistercoris]
MWYVIQVRTGTEENIRLQCEAKISENILERCFIPHYEERRKIRGEWRTMEKVLFPGYVFLITEEVEELFLQLRKVIGLTKLLGTGNEITALSEMETAFLERLGGEEQIVRMSEGIIEESRAKILSGPLMGMEGQIRKIDRHKRKAWLEVEMFGRLQMVEIGLEITMKTI